MSDKKNIFHQYVIFLLLCSGYLPAATEGYGKVMFSFVSSLEGGTPTDWSQVLSRGVPPVQAGGGVPLSYPPPQTRDKVMLRRARYASCSHAGGLSCFKMCSSLFFFVLDLVSCVNTEAFVWFFFFFFRSIGWTAHSAVPVSGRCSGEYSQRDTGERKTKEWSN